MQGWVLEVICFYTVNIRLINAFSSTGQQIPVVPVHINMYAGQIFCNGWY